jgi:hypothetical protein
LGQRIRTSKSLPEEYRAGNSLETWGIPFNGLGWDETSGQLSMAAIFFVENPTLLQLEIATMPGKHVSETSLAKIQAKIGLEFLDRTSIILKNNIWIVRFAGPKEPCYQHGVQAIFLAALPAQELAEGVTTPWVLTRLTWHATAPQ